MKELETAAEAAAKTTAHDAAMVGAANLRCEEIRNEMQDKINMMGRGHRNLKGSIERLERHLKKERSQRIKLEVKQNAERDLWRVVRETPMECFADAGSVEDECVQPDSVTEPDETKSTATAQPVEQAPKEVAAEQEGSSFQLEAAVSMVAEQKTYRTPTEVSAPLSPSPPSPPPSPASTQVALDSRRSAPRRRRREGGVQRETLSSQARRAVNETGRAIANEAPTACPAQAASPVLGVSAQPLCS